MRDLLFLQSVMRDFPFKFPWWLILFETRSRDIEIDSYDTNFLPFFLVPRPLISSDQMIIGYLLTNLTYHSFFSVMRDSFKKNLRDAR